MSRLAQKWEPRYCHDCGPLSPHVENCDHCFGWGRTAHNRVITAGMARGGETWDGTAYSLDHARPCPQCGGRPPDSAPESEGGMSYDDRPPDGATLPEYRGAFTTRPCPECGATIMGWRVRCDDCAAPARVSSPDSAVDTGADDE